MSTLAIRAADVSKRYTVGAPGSRPDTFREAFMAILTASARRLGRRAEDSAQHIWALRDVGFEIHRGEVVGIIGRNGAGKTTLLKILSRITAPTRGRIEFRGRIASLLEVGTGFHPELTGRENIFVNGTILGMSRAEIRRRFDEIVAFAEVERFLDTPVKRYSSGMAVRLAFSVAAHLDPEVLLVDEVLAVGDAQFQQRCLGKLDRAGREGRTVLFVSHNLGAVSKLCTKGMFLSAGRLVAYGAVREALSAYASELTARNGFTHADLSGPLKDRLVFRRMLVNGRPADGGVHVAPGETIRISIVGEAMQELAGYRTTVSVSKGGQLVVSLHDAAEPGLLVRGRFESEVVIPSYFLSPGEYSVSVGGYTVESGEWTWTGEDTWFSVLDEWSKDYDTLSNMGVVNLPSVGHRVRLD
jgi:lipopolysaccharide transport system ATP-binding protein